MKFIRDCFSNWRFISFTVLAMLALSSCGGGSPTGGGFIGGGGSTEWVEGEFEQSFGFKDLCENPRSGSSQTTGNPFPDLSGSTAHENHWLRSWTNETYLWYDEVVDRNPEFYNTASYFDLLKTEAITASGADKDQFHFSAPTDEYEALSQSGVSAGYGFQYAFLSVLPYEIAIAYVEPSSPAANTGISRGARIISIDGVDTALPSTQEEADTLNAGLRPSAINENHSFVIQDLGSSSTRTVILTSESITLTPVRNVMSIPTTNGNVGYMVFNDHIATSEQLLIDAVNQLAGESVQDLILDLRYNGGGFLAIASQLAYMIAGDTATNGQTFETLSFNDQHPVFNPVTGGTNDPFPFLDIALGYSATAGDDLPSLDLPRVFVLTTANTCSASESIINSLRGIGIEVIQIGDTTCGKPYGFYPTDNCGTTYFTIQFQTENALGFGDYADGFAPQDLTSLGSVSLPGCYVEDDFDNMLGDTDEALLAKALQYRETDSCADLISSSTGDLTIQKTRLRSTPAITPKPIWLQNRALGTDVE